MNEENNLFIALHPNDITLETTHLEIEPFTLLGVGLGGSKNWTTKSDTEQKSSMRQARFIMIYYGSTNEAKFFIHRTRTRTHPNMSPATSRKFAQHTKGEKTLHEYLHDSHKLVFPWSQSLSSSDCIRRRCFWTHSLSKPQSVAPQHIRVCNGILGAVFVANVQALKVRVVGEGCH